MTKLYHGPEGFGWQIPGQQERKAERVDVPSSPAELAEWLNERWVPRDKSEPTIAEVLALEQHQQGAGGAVLDQADVDQVNAQRPTFLGKLTAAEIERHRMAANRCPKCNAAAAIELLLVDTEQLRKLIGEASLDQLQTLAEAIRDQVRELDAKLDVQGEGRVQ